MKELYHIIIDLQWSSLNDIKKAQYFNTTELN